MAVISRGFSGRRRGAGHDLPPGQYLTTDFPVLSAGPTPDVGTGRWSFTIRDGAGNNHGWRWDDLMRLPAEDVHTDIHCVTRWSKLATTWRGVPLDALFASVEPVFDYTMVHSYGGYTTNIPLDDLLDGKAWLAFEYDGKPLPAEHGGPVRLLVPHLYFWKSAKWVQGIVMHENDDPGFWERNGYHTYGDPWREQRYS